MVTCIFNLGTWDAEGGRLCVAEQVVRPSYRQTAALSEREAVVMEVTCFRTVSTSICVFSFDHYRS